MPLRAVANGFQAGVSVAAIPLREGARAPFRRRFPRNTEPALLARPGPRMDRDSRAPLVVCTAVGSLAAMGTLISIPVVSQLLGCTPLRPLGWAQALGAAGAATGAIAVVNAVAESWGTSDKGQPDPNTAPDAASDGSPQSPRRPRARAA